MMRAIALELSDGQRWRVSVTRRLEAVAEVAIGRVNAEVKVCFRGYEWQCGVGDGGVWVDCRGGGGRG